MARISLALGATGLLALALLAAPRGAAGTGLLTNGSFEDWGGPGQPTGWTPAAGTVAAPVPGATGTGLGIGAGASASVAQVVDGVPGAEYTASVLFNGTAGASVTLTIEFLNSGFEVLPLGVASAGATPPPGAWTPVSVTATAPAGTVSITLTIALAGAPLDAAIDDANLELVGALPPPGSPSPPDGVTPVPTAGPATATPAAGETAVATPEPPAAGGTAAPGSAATATRTATPAGASTSTPRAATARASPGTRGGALPPVDSAPPRPTATASPSGAASAGATATGPATATAGGLLRNGGFEDDAGGIPAGWGKFGGTMGLGAARSGRYAVTLASETASTKWLYQAAAVEAGEWYEAAAWGRVVVGGGEVFLRLSWHASAGGEGSAISQDDSPAAGGSGWELLRATFQAPPGARSVRVRLMLRPAGPAIAAFDDAHLIRTVAPPPSALGAEPPPASSTPAAPSTSASSGVPGTAQPVSGQPPSTAPGAPQARASALTLRLSELLPDPEEAGRDSAFEWVELFNEGPEPVELLGWKLGDGRELDPLPVGVVPGGGFLVVAAKSAKLPPGIAVTTVADGEIGAGLNNTGDTLQLVAPNGDTVDAVSWGDDRSVLDPPAPAPAPGGTLARRGAGENASTWDLASTPTPGEPNRFAAPATATPEPGTTAITAGRTASPIVREGGNGGSALPWVVLGMVAGAGAAGVGVRAFPAIKRRATRGRRTAPEDPF